MNIKIFISFVICKIAHGFIPQQNVNVCVFKTGPGQVNLLTLATNKMLKTNTSNTIQYLIFSCKLSEKYYHDVYCRIFSFYIPSN